MIIINKKIEKINLFKNKLTPMMQLTEFKLNNNNLIKTKT